MLFFPRCFIVILSFLLLAACTVNPVTLRREFNVISEERELGLGKNASYSVIQEMGLYDDAELQHYVNEVGQRLVNVSDRHSIPYQFKVIDSPILNAFALPGGYIFITRGLLAELENEAQLASVLGHEIGHVCARHSVTQLSEALGYQLLTLAAIAAPGTREMAPVTAALFQSITLGYSREKEFEADSMGLAYMYRAGYNPMEVSTFLYHLSKRAQGPAGYSVYNATHPDIFDRISETRSKAKLMVALDITRDKLREKNGIGEAGVTKEEVINPVGNVFENEYKSHLDGLLYGPPQAPHRIRIHTVSEGETLESIARDVLKNQGQVKEIADFNNLEIDSPLKAGQKLKLIY